ncbi:hypothetical protein ACF0H5_012461 [Mactra antiquata]
MNATDGQGPPPGMQGPPAGGASCGPPPGWTGPPPPGPYANAAEMLWKTVPPIIIVLGVFGNILTVLILLRHARKLSSTAIFLMALAFSDTLFLFNAPLRQWIRAVWKTDVRWKSSLGCKFSIYLTYCSSQFSSWLLVAVTVERFISIVRPHHVRIGCTSRLAGVIIVALFVLIYGLNTHIFYGFGRSNLPRYFGQGLCEAMYEEYYEFWTKVYSWIDLAVVFLVPFLILLVANSIIIYKLRQTRTIRRRLSIVKTRNEQTQAKDSKLVTVMLILLSVVFFVCLTPVSIFFVYRPYWMDKVNPTLCSDLYGFIAAHERIDFTHAITNIIGYINAAFNFVLYVISGSKFRAELKSLFLCQPGRGIGVFGGATAGSVRRSTITTQTASRSGSQRSISSVNAEPMGTSMQQDGKEEVSESITNGIRFMVQIVRLCIGLLYQYL